MKNLTVFYRISDKGNTKNRMQNSNNKTCLDNFIKEFSPSQIEIIADNVEQETKIWLESYNFKKLHITSLGNSGSFWYAFNEAIKLDKNSYIYFVEDDYLHKPNSQKVLIEGLQIADYVTLYDHPDKYVDGINPRVKNGSEKSKVFLTDSSHWKITNSTPMTFASQVKTLQKDGLFFKLFSICLFKSDLPILNKFGYRNCTRSYRLFTSLKDLKNRILISSIPGYSTHTENSFLTPLTNWEDFNNQF